MLPSKWIWWVVLLTGAVALCAGSGVAGELGTSFWVWHGSEPGTPAEWNDLKAAGIDTLYWEVGEMDCGRGHWSWVMRNPMPETVSSARIVPVVRLTFQRQLLLNGTAADELVRLLGSVAGEGNEMQVDFDCPDRLLGRYAAVLKRLRRPGRRVSATALAGWSGNPAWPELQSSVDELFPMFYDLEADPPLHPILLIDGAKLAAELRQWDRCRIQWQAGLPTFARVTVDDAVGVSRGHIRAWDWDDLCFNTALVNEPQTQPGTTTLRVAKNGLIGETPVQDLKALMQNCRAETN